ncbi:hypothetical protein [Sinorhizobium fredii]|uniref:hypothetical protein n=1 Tax=Rhizobium fredii TaxID=380 RepID=UPI0011813C83|nr:hypothetical protein [Sinorhizobium fredii]
MNDISVWPKNASNPGAGDQGVGGKYSAGQIHAVIDFTTSANISGGPTWSLTNYEGPGKNLLSATRVAKHQLIFTFIPICIRNKHRQVTAVPPFQYSPELPHGTPRWANFLPSCSSSKAALTKANALQSAHDVNVQERSREIRILPISP